MNNTIVLKRDYKKDVTLGVLKFSDGTILHTVELPWLNNKPMVSCIPEGQYILKKRSSPVVRRSSGNKYEQGWQVTNVPDRSFIMIHVGNTVNDFNGCIGVGTAYGRIKGLDGVINSRVAFDILMKKMELFETWNLIIEKE